MAVLVVVALLLQAIIASVGLGMSDAAAFEPGGFEICSSAGHHVALSDAAGGQDKSDHRPQCPFCLAAAQGANHPATVADRGAFPAHATQHAAEPLAAANDIISVPRSRRTTGDPRGPPPFFV